MIYQIKFGYNNYERTQYLVRISELSRNEMCIFTIGFKDCFITDFYIDTKDPFNEYYDRVKLRCCDEEDLVNMVHNCIANSQYGRTLPDGLIGLLNARLDEIIVTINKFYLVRGLPI